MNTAGTPQINTGANEYSKLVLRWDGSDWVSEEVTTEVPSGILDTLFYENLNSDFNSAGVSGEEELTDLKITLPVKGASERFDIEVEAKFHAALPASGSTFINIRYGTDNVAPLTNNPSVDQIYQPTNNITDPNMISRFVLRNVDLSTQRYFNVGVTNASGVVAFSGFQQRCSITVKIYTT